jgi:hypothetical protein
MKRKGCKPQGIALVEHLDGSLRAKERLEVILATITGQLTIGQACQRLGVCEARFHRLRTEALKASLERLEPRAVGRRPRQASPDTMHCKDLERQIEELQADLKIAVVREEVARVLPHPHEPPLKKTTEIPKRK